MIRRKIAALALAGALALSLSSCSAPAFDGDTTDCTITGKDIIASTDSNQMRVFTSCGTFNVGDDLWRGQWNSADLYGSLEEGKTYNFTAWGWRNGFFSIFPHITAAQEVSE